MFRNIQDQFQHAMESDTMDPRVMEGNVHLPEDETKCNHKFTQMSISVAGYPSMEMVSYPVSDDWIEDTEKKNLFQVLQTMYESAWFEQGQSGS